MPTLHHVSLLAIQAMIATVFASAAHAQAPVPTLRDQAQKELPRQSEFFPDTSKPEVVFSGGCGITEGLVADATGRIYFTEITRALACADNKGVPGGRIWVLEPGKTPRIYRDPSNMANGLAIDDKKRLYAAEGSDYGGRRVSMTDLQTGEYRVIGYFYENRHFNSPNDIKVDAQGRVFFTDMRSMGPEVLEQRINGVYRLDPLAGGAKGTWPIKRVIGDSSKVNGIEISQDGRTLFTGVCDTGNQSLGEQGPPPLDRMGSGGIVAYTLNAAGDASNPRVIVDLEKRGCVDGMTTDADGNLYAAMPLSPVGPGVFVFAPDGSLVARLTLPGEIPTTVTFGRASDATSLYVGTLTSGKVYRLKVQKGNRN